MLTHHLLLLLVRYVLVLLAGFIYRLLNSWNHTTSSFPKLYFLFYFNYTGKSHVFREWFRYEISKIRVATAQYKIMKYLFWIYDLVCKSTAWLKKKKKKRRSWGHDTGCLIFCFLAYESNFVGKKFSYVMCIFSFGGS